MEFTCVSQRPFIYSRFIRRSDTAQELAGHILCGVPLKGLRSFLGIDGGHDYSMPNRVVGSGFPKIDFCISTLTRYYLHSRFRTVRLEAEAAPSVAGSKLVRRHA